LILCPLWVANILQFKVDLNARYKAISQWRRQIWKLGQGGPNDEWAVPKYYHLKERVMR
tara:strand:+ start:294 stop:470 length:177 start_codon:yes stop_codon:yes gene_type:complete